MFSEHLDKYMPFRVLRKPGWETKDKHTQIFLQEDDSFIFFLVVII